MVSKNKKRVKKRKSEELAEITHVPLQKRKYDENEVLTIGDDDMKEHRMDLTEGPSILPTRESLAHQLMVALRGRHFTIIEGPMGSGKTFIASYASRQLSLPLKTMQMGDQVDSKNLFGCYHCTEVAGQFLWKPSSFCRWLQDPGLILLEDIDLSNADVTSTVVELISRRSASLPCGDVVSLHRDVCLVATVSGKGKRCSVLDGVPVRIKLEQLTDEELRRLVTKESPRIAHLAKTLISIFRSVEAVPPTSNSRQLTSADLLRGCARVNKLSDLSSNISIFTELLDTWCLAESPDRATVLCKKVAAALSITEDQMSFHLSLRQPSFTHDDTSCVVGRCRLSCSPSLTSMQKHRLGHTRDVLQLMERLAVCVQHREPVLLVGETGVGKTSIVQSLASALNVTLKVVNLSPSSDIDELISGYKPASIAHVLQPFTHFYHDVFADNFDVKKNQKFLSHLEVCLSSGRYRDYLSVVIATAEKALTKKSTKDPRWASVIVRGKRIQENLKNGAAFLFAVSRGAVLEAAQEGYWLLIDEINLAPPESLDAIVHAISEDVHPNFRLFACMNPATDAGKRRLPPSVRTRFTEFYVPEMSDPHQIALVVSAYLPSMKAAPVSNLVNFYRDAKHLHPSSYSLRTLCRALMFASENMFGNEDRSLYEAICMAFLTNLDSESKEKMRTKVARTFPVATNIPVPPPGKADCYVSGYWIERGTELPREDSSYVVTKTVKRNLAEIARITSSGRFPILLEGETSAGKTSIIYHLARLTGNAVLRINNHEHTDVQEYMGSYVGDSNGRLVFREGSLVQAVRSGSWVILDELNLAPTDIIEALNRLLDDNRELYVPELNTVIRAHPRFRLFATQNPAGSYGGRKRLSRALLSRFVLLRFNHIPLDELSSMVCVRCGVHPSAAAKMISVLSKLRVKRSVSGVFSAKDGLMTLRDVFRWAKRLVTDSTCDDWLQVLANHGYFLLAGRCRNQKDVASVVETLESELKRKIEPAKLFALNSPYMPKDADVKGIVMTFGMRRMLVMTEQAWIRNEAVLMVGETGGGKTSLAQVVGRGKLITINCHERTETADLLGRLRPRENGGFCWADGVVISAMKEGAPLLIDEISLAEDSVLERLNPLFEEDRTLLLSDAGVEAHPVSASVGFQMIATMNPGGDYGKKELSKALRNRFTEIWSSCDFEGSELLAIFDSRLKQSTPNSVSSDDYSLPAKVVIKWIAEFFKKYLHLFRQCPSVRDVVACADIYAACVKSGLPECVAIHEAVSAVFLDALNNQHLRIAIDVNDVREDAKDMLQLLCSAGPLPISAQTEVRISSDRITIGALSVPYGSLPPTVPKGFSLSAPTCISNFYRIARGLLINKPILLEGAPGCGKSSTVMALAMLTGHPITRLNLSDQTDLSDLFGSDVPIVTEDGSISFRWEDGPVLQAIKRGEWVLLDEMNLASQAVLEGLNACFDHRRLLYIAELNRSFEIPPESNCRFFACQNPRGQGGNRRALPKSFVNRFTNIYVEDLKEEDILLILRELPAAAQIGEERLKGMVSITSLLASEHHLTGGPFSFNLRDLLRWVQLFEKNNDIRSCFQTLFLNRMRSEDDRQKLRVLYEELFAEPCVPRPITLTIDEREIRIGLVSIPRFETTTELASSTHRLLASQATLMHQLATCIDMKWMSLIIGPRNCGKRSTLENLAALCGVKLQTIVLNAETDAQELIGSYEQVVDDSALNNAKATLGDLLRPYIDDATLKQLRNANDVTELETVAEMLFVDLKERHANVVEECREALAHASRSAMRFEWIDSAFVRAYLNGHWLLIEDVNLCSAAVLDRLNSCLESDGRLVISERQSSFEPLEPHPNFRVFLSMDARNGEISRAMRNRSVEMFVSSEQQWNTNPPDVIAVTSSQERIVSVKLSEMLSALPIAKQLHFSALLNEMTAEEACRAVGLSYSEGVDNGSQYICIAPLIKELHNERYDSWILEVWKNSCDSDFSPSLYLALLSTSTNVLRGSLIAEVFGECASPSLNRLRNIAQGMEGSHQPIDPRFHHVISGGENRHTIERFVIATVCDWFSSLVKAYSIAAHSAEHYSRSLSKFEMTKIDIGFKNLQLIARVVDAIKDALNSDFKICDEHAVFSCCLHLALFVIASRRPLDSRTGCASLYLAWNELLSILQKSFEFAKDDQNSSCSSLLKLIQLMSEGWPVEAHERFINFYLPLYEEHRLAEPFGSDEETERLSSCLLSSIPKRSLNETQHSDSMEDDDVDVRKSKSNPVRKTLNLISVMRELHRFFSTGTTGQIDDIFTDQLPFEAIRWRNEGCRRFAAGIALLNSEYLEGKKISSLRHTDAFSTAFLSFWEEVDFDLSLSSLSVQHLMQCELKAFASQLWRLAPNSSMLSQCIKDELKCASRGLPGWADADGCSASEDGWKRRMEIALVIMENSLPPSGTLDPVIFGEERVAYQSSVFDAVNKPLTVLARWRQAVSRQPPNCDADSTHPVVAVLWRIRVEMEEALSASRERPVVFRQKASQYSSMCGEMRAFFGVASTIVSVLRGLDSDADALLTQFNSSQLSVAAAKLQSFAVSAIGFRKAVLSKFGSFVDVSSTFLQGLDIFLCALHEACDLIEATERRRLLRVTTAFPMRIQMRASSEGLESTELLAWCCRDASPMPLRLKAAVVRRLMSTGDDPMCNLEWIRHQWQKWYERNIAKATEKDFVYRTKTEEEKDELDVQDFFAEFVQEQEILPEADLSALVGIDECKSTSAKPVGSPYVRDSNYAVALLWVRHVLSGVRHFDESMHSATIDSDLALLEEMASKVNNSGNGVIDVYRSASLAEFHRAAGLLEVLAKRTEVIKERWPEQVSLSLILEAIISFRNARLSTTHMKMSVLIENVIEQCEEWEKMADRANSLQHELAPVRELLVDWKKMEVRSWGELLNRVENDGRMRALLVSFPLFDALFKAETPDAQNNLIAMATEWVTNASLLDYAARIRSVHCLAEWARLLGHSSVSLHLHSIAAHYEQYLAVVEASLREAREPAEHALRDYVKIVKFNDLNLWNIKKSSQKAHTHLYKIVRKFRDAVGVPVSPYFDNLVEMDPPCAASPYEIPLVEGVVGHGKRARQLAETILAQAATICDVSAAVCLAEQTKSCDEAIRVQINYQGEDEEKEKQQGYARNSRQRAVAMVIKESQSIGLNARKAMALNQEELTRSSLTEVKRCVAKEPYVRKCAGGRNACIRKAMSPNDQLGVATRKHLLGVVDYGMAWMLKCHRALAVWEDSCKVLTGKARVLERMQSNVEAGWLISHERMASTLDTVHAQATDVLRHTEAMLKRMTRVPDLDDSEQESNGWEHPLSRLHSQSPETNSVVRLVDEVHSLSKRMQLTTSQLVAESEHEIFEKSLLVSSLEHLSADGAELEIRLEELQKWFEFDCTSARSTLRRMMPKLKAEFVAGTAASVSLDPALLFVQNLYKALVENANTSEMRLMDRLDLTLSAMLSSGVEKVVGSVSQVVSECRIGVVPDCLDEMTALLRVVTQLFSSMNTHISTALSSFASLYYTLLSMSMQLFEKGYVNLIPKAEKQESGQGNADEAGEGGGMGEGEARSDAKDVTDEMEESGQIEGLQDDECEPPTGDAGQNEKPIEMEEDFPEDIQDIDRNEAGDEENSGEDSEEEPEPEDQMGDVDDADDQQLDPKLWDEEEKDQSPQSMDDDTAAADNETNELAAKDDDSAAAGEKPEEDTAKGSTEEEADDVENADERDEDGEEETDAEKEDTSLQPEDGVDVKETEEEAANDGRDSTDEEQENEVGEGAGDEENKEDNEEDDLVGENPAENPANDEDMESRKDQVEVIEEGTGGEKTNDEKKDESGGGNEDEDKENEENQGKGQSKSDERGEAGKSAEKVNPEEKKSEKEQEDAEKEEVSARERELAKENSSVEDKDEGEGEQDETGCEMQNVPAADRQMVGAGSLEEAKLSKKDEPEKKPIERKKPLAGTEEAADGPMEIDDAASLEQQGAIHLAAEEMYSLVEELTKELTVTSIEQEVTYDITERAEAGEESAEEAEKTWAAMCQTVAILAAELAENLRLILEPQRASKMQGDYRTGKRLNMRRLIPYIASDYRKDRIWMRRTKKAQRDYQVLIAVDDSASMNENGIHQVTCESVCIVEDALRRCDAGGVAVCSFGSDVKVINAFGDHMMPGPELLQKLSFNQSSTDLLLLLNRSRQMLRDVRTPTSEQLLIIISDGRGALAQGAEKVKAALAALQGVTVLFVILDSGPKSICELSVASFQGENVVLTPYLSSFPFPFYAIVKAVTQLPSTLAESIRQWFEMTVQTNSI